MKNKLLVIICLMGFFAKKATGTNVLVNTLAGLSSAYTAALPGDTIRIANGTYNWGAINISNTRGTSTSAWIVVMAQNRDSVVFTGSTYIWFQGTRVHITGFRFSNGNSGMNAVMAFRSSSTKLSNYCRISNITFDNYNTRSIGDTTENEWVGIFGTNNRLDHCTFINKCNARATVVVWYSTATFPAQSISTYHRIDSNYFKGRSFMGSNGGETIRVGVGNNSRTYGYNTIEYNLFENCTQTEPEIVSNKSAYNTYRYNTFKNCNGGLTLRMGKYCSVYGNYFINNDPTKTDSYGIRIIDKGHKVFNNYCEGLLGSAGSLTSMRHPIVIYNGYYTTADSLNPLVLNGSYLPADDAVVAFNTIVNCSGGSGINIGHTDGGLNLNQPTGVIVSNNVIKMSSGQAVYVNPLNTALTFLSEGNMYAAPAGLGITNTTGFVSNTLSFGPVVNGTLTTPLSVQNAAVNSNNYAAMLANADMQAQARNGIFDVGADEIAGIGMVANTPLDSNMVGSGKPFNALRSQVITFASLPIKTVGNADFNPGATTTSGLTVTYNSSNTAVATIVNGNIHIVGYGTAVITASQGGNSIYAAAPSVTQTLTVNGLSQTISFNTLPAKVVGDADFSAGATASSGLAVTYSSSNTLVATIVNNLIHIVGPGSAVITASQAGNTTYLPATSVSQSLTVTKIVSYTPVSTTITSGTLNSGVFGNLATNNASYYVVNSTTSSTRKIDWYASIKITQPANSVVSFTVNYDGKNSASKTQILYLYDWVTATWTQIDSRSVSTTDVNITYTQNAPANFISSTGDIRVRVYSSAGTSNYTCSGDWLQVNVKTSSTLKMSSLETDDSVINTAMGLYPNPSSQKTQLNYALQTDSKVSIQLYNSLGKFMKSIVNQNLQASGVHTAYIDTHALAPGVYYLVLIVNGQKQTKKLIVNGN